MFGKKGIGKIQQIGNGAITGISPPRSKFVAVAAPFSFGRFAGFELFDMGEAGGVAVVFGVCSVGNNKQLHVLEQAAASPETLPAVPVNLIECFFQIHTTTFQLDMNER